MATRRSQSNPFSSANLGSGARTTTGGTYENPRLGIEDYTAFGRGVASTFRLPQQQEEGELKQLEGGIDYFGRQKDEFLNGSEFKSNSLLVNKFANGPLSQMQAQYAKCSKANNQRCLQDISADLGIYQVGQNNFKNLIQNYADSEVYDSETSKGRFLIDVNGNQIMGPNNKPISLADITRVNNENPQDINIGIALNKNGEKKAVYQFKMDGKTYTTNLTDLDNNYLQNNFDVRDNLMLNIQNTMIKDGATHGYDDSQYDFVKIGDVVTNAEGGKVEVTETNITQYIPENNGFIDNALTYAAAGAKGMYPNMYSPNVNSGFNTLMKRLNSKDKEGNPLFNVSKEIQDALDTGGYNINNPTEIPNDIKYDMLIDQAEQEWLISNASRGYKRGSDGRAVLRGEELLEKKKVTTPVDEEGGLGATEQSRVDRFFRLFNKGLDAQTFGKNVSVEGKPGFVINESGIENFFQEYGLPLEGKNRKVGGIKYTPDKYGKGGMPGDAGLGTLEVAWVESDKDKSPNEFITYDLNDEGSVKKLVNKIASLGKDKELGPNEITAIVNQFKRLKDVVKGGALRNPADIQILGED